MSKQGDLTRRRTGLSTRRLWPALSVLLLAAGLLLVCLLLDGGFPRHPSRRSEAELAARVAARPDDLRAVEALAKRYVDSDRPREAEALLSEAVARAPDDAKLHNRLGVARAMLGDRKGARAAFDRALVLEPNLASARANRARLAGGAGDMATALPDAREAVRLEPNDPEYQRLLGNLLTEIQDHSGAADAYAAWARLSPRCREAHIAEGFACVRAERYAQGAAALRAARDLGPLEPPEALFLGLALAEAPTTPQDAAEAERLLRGIVAAGQDEGGLARYGLGLLAARANQWNEAVVWFRAAADADPDAERPRYRLARALLKAGRREEAARELAAYDRLFRARRQKPNGKNSGNRD